jgi:hypothetical protein
VRQKGCGFDEVKEKVGGLFIAKAVKGRVCDYPYPST